MELICFGLCLLFPIIFLIYVTSLSKSQTLDKTFEELCVLYSEGLRVYYRMFVDAFKMHFFFLAMNRKYQKSGSFCELCIFDK